VLRLLLLLLGSVGTSRVGRRDPAVVRSGGYPDGTVTLVPQGQPHHQGAPSPAPSGPAYAPGQAPGQETAPGSPGYWPPGQPPSGPPPGQRRRRIPLWVKWAAVAGVAALIFRRAVSWLVVSALSAALHLVGVNIHLPHVTFGWPWQTISTGTTTNVDLGPSVLQKLQGISHPAFSQANFTFLFTHKVSKNIGPWPCWYASTFNATAHASATVNLNPGPSWWAKSTGHYRLQVLSTPAAGKPGRVSVAMVLPLPQLPRSVHDITVDNTLSKPIYTDHSFTYPGFGCGVLLKPQFTQSVLYAQAQQIAFYKATQSPAITQPLIRTAESQATKTIRDNFIQPTLNALGYKLTDLTIRWSASTGAVAPRPTG
jgi:hypothetical protein